MARLSLAAPALRTWLVVGYDLAAAAASFPLAVAIRAAGDGPSLAEYAPVLAYGTPLFVVIAALVFALAGTSRGMWRYTSLVDLLTVCRSGTLAVLLFLPALFAIDRLETIARAVPFIQWFVLLGLLGGGRLFYTTVVVPLRTPRPAGPPWQPVLLVGAGSAASVLIQLLRTQGAAPYEVVGLLDERCDVGRTIRQVPVLGGPADLGAVVAKLTIHGMRPARVVLARPTGELSGEALERLYAEAEQHGILVQELVDLLRLDEAAAPPAGPAAVGVLLHRVERRSFFLAKRLVDIAVAAVGLVLTAPLVGVAALGVWYSMGRPVIFHQVRPGRGLESFTLYKLKTLRDGHRPDGTILPDPARRTRFGAFLRRTRLDELPQLWNVLVGDMSLIGPRPLLPRDLPELGEAARERFSVRPGITGWAQVNGGHMLSPDEKLALDLYYIRRYTPWLDLVIVVRTLEMMIWGERIDRRAIARAEFERGVA